MTFLFLHEEITPDWHFSLFFTSSEGEQQTLQLGF